MSFTLTYDTMVRSDIKNVYSGGRQLPTTSRDRGEGERSLLEIARARDVHQLKMNMILHRLGDDQKPRDHLPRAPAFSAMSRKEIDKVVERLRKPTVASKGITRRSEELAMEARHRSPRFSGVRSLSSDDLHAAIERLRAPTTVAVIRQQQTQHGV